MCGIVGYVGPRDVRPLLLAGLEKLEYRGYDSAGISVLAGDEIASVRAVGNLSALRSAMAEHESRGAVAVAETPAPGAGIGHTRWATHGRVSEENAHPHGDCNDRIQIVLNGIVENHTELRGHYAFAAMHADHPDTLVAARQECPLVVGLGEDETFVASAIPAFLTQTRHVLLIENGEVVTIDSAGATVTGIEGSLVEREAEEVQWDQDAAEKGGYETFMLKEIHEQADSVAETITDRLSQLDRVDLSELDLPDDFIAGVRRIVIVACGTSYHAGLVGRYAIEQWARIPVEMDIASEYRYRDPVVGPDDLVIGITQSGETADTLAAMRLARERGAKVLALTNIMGSQATRDADAVLFTRAGLEIGVAATKTFTAQVAAMYLLGLWLAGGRDALPRERIATLIEELKSMPTLIDRTIESVEETVRQIAADEYGGRFFLYLGRNIGLPVCLEGALKMKEISYIPSDAYAAGEMKHGPIALLDESTPVVCVATESPVLDKMLSNMAEVSVRGADVIAVATEGSERVAEGADEILYVPATDWILQPILAILPLQLLAYHVARLKGLNVDQPRNLAKTVTVE